MCSILVFRRYFQFRTYSGGLIRLNTILYNICKKYGDDVGVRQFENIVILVSPESTALKKIHCYMKLASVIYIPIDPVMTE